MEKFMLRVRHELSRLRILCKKAPAKFGRPFFILCHYLGIARRADTPRHTFMP
jgi:hypothetical protein